MPPTLAKLARTGIEDFLRKLAKGLPTPFSDSVGTPEHGEKMKATFASRKHALRMGKSLRDYFPGIPLATCQEWAAKILGYRDLHELTAVSEAPKAGASAAWAYDEECSREEIEKRRRFQVDKLVDLAKVDEGDAQLVIAELAPTAKRKPGRNSKYGIEMTSSAFLNVGNYMAEGDLNEGLRVAIQALKTGQRATLLGKVSTLLVIERSMKEAHDPKLLRELLELGSEAGWSECSYNLANSIAGGWSDTERNVSSQWPPREEVATVDRLYAKVMAHKEEPDGVNNDELRSAAMVNRAALIRDGLLTGVEDWPAAVKLYEQAAELGNVVGAFNAGNVSAWLSEKGERAYAARSAKWYRRAIEMVEAGAIKPTHTSPENAKQMAESARGSLAHMVLDGVISAEGDPVLKRITAEHEATCTRAGHGGRVRRFTERVKAATGAAAATPAGNWLRAFTLLGWKCPGVGSVERSLFEDPTRGGNSVRLETVVFPKQVGGQQIKLVVVWDACLPVDDGFARIEAALKHVRGKDESSYLLGVGRKAVIKVHEGYEFTPAWLVKPGEVKSTMVSIGGASTGPMDLVEQATKGRAFASSPGDASLDYEFAIAVNTLDAGVPAARTWDPGTVNWVGVGGFEMKEWRMPYYDYLELVAFGFAPPGMDLDEGI